MNSELHHLRESLDLHTVILYHAILNLVLALRLHLGTSDFSVLPILPIELYFEAWSSGGSIRGKSALHSNSLIFIAHTFVKPHLPILDRSFNPALFPSSLNKCICLNSWIMPSVTQNPALTPHLLSQFEGHAAVAPASGIKAISEPRDISAVFNYYKDNDDGSPPKPNYADKPGSYEREHISQRLLVHNVRGTEDQYTLDKTGFEFYKHESVEKSFADEEHIIAVYYPEVEELLESA
jgi:hypothetical protein